MLGRGMVTDPGLGWAIKASMNATAQNRVGWPEVLPRLAEFWHVVCTRLDARSRTGRLKQWLNFLRRRYPEAGLAYLALRTTNDPLVIEAWLAENLPDHSRAALETTARG